MPLFDRRPAPYGARVRQESLFVLMEKLRYVICMFLEPSSSSVVAVCARASEISKLKALSTEYKGVIILRRCLLLGAYSPSLSGVGSSDGDGTSVVISVFTSGYISININSPRQQTVVSCQQLEAGRKQNTQSSLRSTAKE
eukprot:scaffold29429_cov30-Tisochrysis_lutea.AAC.1